MKNTEWFKDWFNSPYYHILYKDRDENEAVKFIENLIRYFNPVENSTFLDVACGKGRHSVILANYNYFVDGFDLSENSIKAAKGFEKDNLKFFVNDIRNPLKNSYYDYAFNLFTSFGYFDDQENNQLAIDAIADSLKPGAKLVMDFMNCKKVIDNLVVKESKTINNLTFSISRQYIEGKIIKTINFNDQGKGYSFQESVKVIELKEFEHYFTNAGLKINAVLGDYDLQPFNINLSDRLIMIAEKN